MNVWEKRKKNSVRVVYPHPHSKIVLFSRPKLNWSLRKMTRNLEEEVKDIWKKWERGWRKLVGENGIEEEKRK